MPKHESYKVPPSQLQANVIHYLLEHIEDRHVGTAPTGSHNAVTEKQILLRQDLHPDTEMEVESNLDFYHGNNDIIIDAASDNEAADTAQETSTMTPNRAYNYLLAEHGHMTHGTTQATAGPTAEPIEHASTLDNMQRVRPKNFKRINIYKTYEPSTPRMPGEHDIDLPISGLSMPAEYNKAALPTIQGVDKSLKEEDEIATEHNPGYNIPLEHVAPTPSSSHANFGSTSAPTPESEAFISVWPNNKPQRVESTSDTHDSSPGDEPIFNIYKNYEPFIPPTADKHSTDLPPTLVKPERELLTTDADKSIQEDDIVTEHNPGYNIPIEYVTLTPPSSHANSSAPTPESEAFTSVWPRPPRERSTAETPESTPGEELMRLALTETSV